MLPHSFGLIHGGNPKQFLHNYPSSVGCEILSAVVARELPLLKSRNCVTSFKVVTQFLLRCVFVQIWLYSYQGPVVKIILQCLKEKT